MGSFCAYVLADKLRPYGTWHMHGTQVCAAKEIPSSSCFVLELLCHLSMDVNQPRRPNKSLQHALSPALC